MSRRISIGHRRPPTPACILAKRSIGQLRRASSTPGLIDSFRQLRPDVINDRGNTWTPGSPGPHRLPRTKSTTASTSFITQAPALRRHRENAWLQRERRKYGHRHPAVSVRPSGGGVRVQCAGLFVRSAISTAIAAWVSRIGCSFAPDSSTNLTGLTHSPGVCQGRFERRFSQRLYGFHHVQRCLRHGPWCRRVCRNAQRSARAIDRTAGLRIRSCLDAHSQKVSRSVEAVIGRVSRRGAETQRTEGNSQTANRR